MPTARAHSRWAGGPGSQVKDSTELHSQVTQQPERLWFEDPSGAGVEGRVEDRGEGLGEFKTCGTPIPDSVMCRISHPHPSPTP